MRKLMLPMMMADYKLMETWEPWGHDSAPTNGSSGAAGAAGAAPAAAPASPQHQAACCSCFGMGQPAGAPPGMVLPVPLAAFGAEYDNRCAVCALVCECKFWMPKLIGRVRQPVRGLCVGVQMHGSNESG